MTTLVRYLRQHPGCTEVPDYLRAGDGAFPGVAMTLKTTRDLRAIEGRVDDLLVEQDAALARGRQQVRDWTGAFGALLPPPVLAVKALHIPRLRPVIRFDLWDDVIEPLVMLGARPEPTTRQLLRRRERSTDRALYACIGTYIGLSILTVVIGVT